MLKKTTQAFDEIQTLAWQDDKSDPAPTVPPSSLINNTAQDDKSDSPPTVPPPSLMNNTAQDD